MKKILLALVALLTLTTSAQAMSMSKLASVLCS